MKWSFVILFLLVSCSTRKPGPSKAQLIELQGMKGLSGLSLVHEEDGKYIFWSHTDRGPNGTEYRSGSEIMRPFLDPGFHPYWVKFSVDLKTQTVQKLMETQTNVTGLPNHKGDEMPVDVKGKVLKRDLNGIDPESICFDGNFVWMGEEYGPSILKFDLEGKLLKRFSPGNGLPKILATRKLNRGFEGLTCFQDKIYAILQSPLPTENNMIRFIEFDPATEKVSSEYLYPLDSMNADKIGDLSVDSHGRFYVIEQNSEIGPGSFHKIFSFLPGKVHRLDKKLEVDITKAGFDFADKLEGLVVTKNYFIIVNDNDFGLVNNQPVETHKTWLALIKR